ncbi:MAG: YggS family pyridoxal phosphate-dependent enzyme [Ruminococcaceae bacterium]|nr:YggS family pyridoxal phosphate-dependent enzyme [Oscillospiraceae bacterium]
MEKLLNEYREQQCAKIDENLKIVRERINEAAIKSGRTAEDIRLMVVTKTIEPCFINHVIDNSGVTLIGENRVQELLSKKPKLHLDDVEVHLIGHLQTNKVRQVVGEVSTIQSVDRLKVAKEISKQSQKQGITTNVLIEVNIGGEESKFGTTIENAPDLCYQISELPNIKVQGLMTIPPICDDEKVLRQHFSDMKKLFIDIEYKKIDNIYMKILSMGMSSDYYEAILEGANLVRIGSSIFGARQY